jgi:hypothetical protein
MAPLWQAADVRENLGRKHRRIAAAEHAVEERMKEVAATRPDELADPEGMEEAADAISEHADRHEDIAARIEDV